MCIRRKMQIQRYKLQIWEGCCNIVLLLFRFSLCAECTIWGVEEICNNNGHILLVLGRVVKNKSRKLFTSTNSTYTFNRRGVYSLLQFWSYWRKHLATWVFNHNIILVEMSGKCACASNPLSTSAKKIIISIRERLQKRELFTRRASDQISPYQNSRFIFIWFTVYSPLCSALLMPKILGFSEFAS